MAEGIGKAAGFEDCKKFQLRNLVYTLNNAGVGLRFGLSPGLRFRNVIRVWIFIR